MNKMLPPVMKMSTLALVTLFISGCPITNTDEYDQGYADGFYTDSEYWQGYADSYDTVPDGPLLYTGSEIPLIEDTTYEAGYYDGIWYAYNDGYFVSYDYGFTIGFSEGYDIAFNALWYEFLINDVHPEYKDGSFLDGYNDGFSEGSVFGAVDYDLDLPFDWEDAMWDYRSGTDLYIEEVGFGTGEYGNVFLYEYGVDPATYYEKKALATVLKNLVRQPRKGGEKESVASPRLSYSIGTKLMKEDTEKEEDQVSYRALSAGVQNQLNKRPQYSDRFDDRALTVADTWLQRIERYRAERQ